MSTLRFQALKDASGRKPVKFDEAGKKSAIFGSNVSMSINGAEFAAVSATGTTPVVPAKFWVGVCLQKLTIPQKAFFTGVSTQNSPITVLINIGTATSQIHTAMLILNYDAIIEIDTSTKQCVIIQ